MKKAKEEGWIEDRNYHLKTRPLTDRQKSFCANYVKYYNATKSYKEAYPNTSYANANVESRRLLKKPEIRYYIKGLQEEMQESLLFDARAIIQKYIDIAFADVTDILEVDGPMVKLKPEADGTIIQNIRPSPAGPVVEVVDKMTALRELSKRFGLDKSDFDKALEEKKLEVQERRIELQELKEKGDEEALEKLDEILGKIDKEAKG